MNLRRLGIILALCAGCLLPAHARAAGAGDSPIQPGARIVRHDLEPVPGLPYEFYRCTMTFIFSDPEGGLYTGTTGEPACIAGTGARVLDENGAAFGTAVFIEYHPPAGSFTLIKIDASRCADVNPQVRYWGGPTGVASPSTEAAGSLVAFTGNAIVEGDTPQTRSRAGALVHYDIVHFVADTPAELGDSGAPVVDTSNGLAVGMISDFGTGDRPPATDDGPTVERILRDVAAAGFTLTLMTADQMPSCA